MRSALLYHLLTHCGTRSAFHVKSSSHFTVLSPFSTYPSSQLYWAETYGDSDGITVTSPCSIVGGGGHTASESSISIILIHILDSLALISVFV